MFLGEKRESKVKSKVGGTKKVTKKESSTKPLSFFNRRKKLKVNE